MSDNNSPNKSEKPNEMSARLGEINKSEKKQASVEIVQQANIGLIETINNSEFETMLKNIKENGPLSSAVKRATGVTNAKKAPSLAFTESPTQNNNYLGLYKAKTRLLPDDIIKQIRITDHLVATILRSRANMMALYGKLRADRFDIGVEVEIKPEFYKILTPEQYDVITQRIKKFEQILLNCGHTEGLEQHEKTTLADYFYINTYNGNSFGRFATEIIYDRSAEPDSEGNYPFHRFRAIDVGSIYKAVRRADNAGDALRMGAIKALEAITGEKMNIDMAKLREDKYAWIQIVDGQPRQAFSHDEMLVYNLFPSSDLEHHDYPVTPLDTIVSSVTTHISIDAYKKLYFQNGRASKGILVIRSDEVDQSVINNMKLEFNASINSVSNSFRTPIFGIGTTDEVVWTPLHNEGLSDGFEFMYDNISRIIMSAFNMSPDELPGYGHLSRGTGSQSLSESSNEWKLTAARDTGLRPLILKWQTFLNQRLFPLIDPLLSKVCTIKLAGLDAQSVEQENTRLQQNSALFMNFDELLSEVEKDGVGTSFGGKMPFNERFQLIADKFLNVGEVKAKFFNDPSALVDPMLKYKRDPFAIQQMQLLASISPNTIKAMYATRPAEISMELLKMEIEDSLEEDDE
jgi:hypothetical protein